MKSEIRTVTPEDAKEILKLNTNNRNIRKKYVQHLASAILNNEWKLTHQGIAISTDNVLLDGQHRLEAIVLADIPVVILVSTNVDKDSFKVIDNGAKRNIADLAGIEKRLAETSKLACKLINQNPSTEMVLRVAESELGKAIAELTKFAPKNRKLFTSSAFRLSAAFMSMSNKDYAFNSFKSLSLSDIENIPPVALSVLKKAFANTLTYKGGTQGQFEMIADAMYMFNESNKANSKIYMPANKREALLSEIRAYVASVIGDRKC